MGKRKTRSLGVKAGEVYAGQLSDGRYAAVHVITVMVDGHGKGRDSALLGLTRYIGETVPSIDHADVRCLLVQRRFAYDSEPLVWWTEKRPPADYVLVGSYPPTDAELSIDPMGTYGLHWSLHNRLIEWRWHHDREALIGETEARRAELAAAPAPGARTAHEGATLAEADFWAAMALLADAGLDRPDFASAALVAALGRRSEADILEFEEILAEKLYALDRRDLAEHAGEAGDSDDAFLYARCYVVARGREFYEAVSSNPERFPADADFEPLLSVGPTAFEAVTGRSLELFTHVSYETGSNPSGWDPAAT